MSEKTRIDHRLFFGTVWRKLDAAKLQCPEGTRLTEFADAAKKCEVILSYRPSGCFNEIELRVFGYPRIDGCKVDVRLGIPFQDLKSGQDVLSTQVAVEAFARLYPAVSAMIQSTDVFFDFPKE